MHTAFWTRAHTARLSLPIRHRRATIVSGAAAVLVLISIPAANGGTERRPAPPTTPRAVVVRRALAPAPPAPPPPPPTTTVTSTMPPRRPTAPPAPTPPPPAARRGEATVVIARLGIDQPVFLGGQAMIDRWVVAHFTDPRWLPPTDPGAPGTYWLAAHATSTGGPFQALVRAAAGDLVEIRVTNGPTFDYQVTSTEVTGPDVEPSTVYGNDPDARLILLQTCEGPQSRLLVHGVLVGSQ